LNNTSGKRGSSREVVAGFRLPVVKAKGMHETVDDKIEPVQMIGKCQAVACNLKPATCNLRYALS
jgi:hypothetical protein